MTTVDYKQLYHITRRLQMQALDWDRTAQTLVSLVGEALAASYGALMTFHADDSIDKIYVLAQASQSKLDDRELWQRLLRRGLVGHVFYNHHALVLRNLRNDPRWPNLRGPTSVFPQDGSAIGIPVQDEKQFYGVLLYIHPQRDYFSEGHQALLAELAQIGADALRNAAALVAAQTPNTRYLQLFDHSPVPMLLTDQDGIIQDVNLQASAYLGFSAAALQSIPILDLNLQPYAHSQLNEFKERGEASIRASIYDMDGHEIPTLLRVRTVEIDGQMVLEWVLQDMRAQLELEQLRKDLTAMVYHDLRSPLSSILLGNGRLLEILSDYPNPAVPRMLQLGLHSARQLKRMIESLLDIQRIEEDQLVLQRKELPIATLFDQVLTLTEATIEESQQHIRSRIAEDLETLAIDQELITRVLVNLVENAVKYTPDGGNILLTAQERGRYAVLSVIDSGLGIPEEMRTRIFDKFSRVKYENAPKGIGLGLAFCRLAVEAHGGQIWVDSAGQQGSAFRFTLPLYPDDALPPTQPFSEDTGAMDALAD